MTTQSLSGVRLRTALAAGALVLATIGSGLIAAPATAATPQRGAEAQVVAGVNRERARADCAPLRVDHRLVVAARGHSADMARRGYVSHTAPEGRTPGNRITAAGYPRTAWAENIAAGQRNAGAAVTAWVTSPGHARNLRNCSYRATGVGLAYGGRYGFYWTQVFAR